MEKKEKLYLHINVRMDREVDKQEYLWNYVSSYLGSMGLEYLGTSEYQPLERIPEETKKIGERNLVMVFDEETGEGIVTNI